MNPILKKNLFTVLFFLFTLLIGTSSASAHADLLKTSPENGATVAEQPEQLTLQFSQTIELSQVDLTLYDGYARHMPSDPPQLAPGDATRLVQSLPDLGDGTYTVVWSLVSDDGHTISDTLVFHVGAPTKGYLSPSVGTSFLEKGSLFASRALVTGLLLVGGGLFWMTLLARRFRSRTQDASDDSGSASAQPAGLKHLLGGKAKALYLLLLLGLTAEWFAYSATLPGDGLLPVLTACEWTLLTDTPFALMVTVQIGLLLLLALPNMQTGWYAGIWALLIGSLAFGGHAWSIEPVWLSLTVRALHLLTLGLWLGGLAYLMLTMTLSRKSADPAADGLLTGADFRRFFTRTMLSASLLLAATGIVMTGLQTDILMLSQAKLWTGLLVLKLLLLLGMLTCAAVQTVNWGQEGKLSRKLLRGEWLFGLLAVLAAVWLSQSQYPLPDEKGVVPAVNQHQHNDHKGHH